MLSVAAIALLASTLAADPASLPVPSLVAADVRAAPSSPTSHLGLQVDVGLPHGAGAALSFGPWRWLRLEVGAAHNGAAAGVRGGLTVAPLRSFIRPTLSAQAGTFPKGDIRPFARSLGAGQMFDSSFFSSVQYDFLSAQLGVEVGAPAGTSFFLRAGLSRATARFLAAQDAIREASGDPNATAQPLVLNVNIPSLQLGLSVSFI